MPAAYPAIPSPAWSASAEDCVVAATPSSTRFPVTTLLKTLPRARNETAFTAPEVMVSSTTL